MEAAAVPENEALRLATLMCLQIVDTPAEARFDRITRLVAAYFQVASAAINLIVSDQQWTKSHVGMTTTTLPRTISFCAHAILEDDVLIIPDAKHDARFFDNPLVTGAPSIRFYAGIPLRSPDGYALGALCITDSTPRTLTDTEIAHLRDFAAWAEQELLIEDLSVVLLRQQEVEDALRMSEARYATILASLSEGIVFQDTAGQIYTYNASAERILGLSADQMVGKARIDSQWHTVHEDGTSFPWDQHPAMMALQTGQPQQQIVMGVYKADDTLTWITVNAHPLYHAHATQPYGVVSSFVDITQQKQYEHQLRVDHHALTAHNATLTVLAATDGLTGIANKRTLMERLGVYLVAAQQMHQSLALVMIDVDHFKSYNDTFGHLAGDEVLQHVAQLLATHARSTDLVARYGGEEFVIVLPNTSIHEAAHLAERVRAMIERTPFPQRRITASFGIAVAQDQSQSSTGDALIARADAALYDAKHQGRNMVVCAAAPNWNINKYTSIYFFADNQVIIGKLWHGWRRDGQAWEQQFRRAKGLFQKNINILY